MKSRTPSATFKPGRYGEAGERFIEQPPAVILKDGSLISLHGFDPVCSDGRHHAREKKKLPTMDTRNAAGYALALMLSNNAAETLARARLASEVFETVFKGTESFRDDHAGAVLVYLLGAIVDPAGGFVDWRPDCADEYTERFRERCKKLFPKDHAVWRFIKH